MKVTGQPGVKPTFTDRENSAFDPPAAAPATPATFGDGFEVAVPKRKASLIGGAAAPASPEAARLTDPAVFDARYYLDHNPDLGAAGITTDEGARQHWVQYGVSEGRAGCADFDPGTYLDRYPDLTAAYGRDTRKATQHYLTCGITEGRSGAPGNVADPAAFDARYYLDHNPDLRAAGIATEEGARQHWVQFGVNEGRAGRADFDPRAYLARYPDLTAAYGQDTRKATLHYLAYGISEGRSAAPGSVSGPTTPATSATTAIPAGGMRVGNAMVQVGIAPRTAGAVNSLVVNGKEYINDFDHGRQMQVAWQLNLAGEGNNPTEAGSSHDDVGPTSSSRVLKVEGGGDRLSVTSQPAFWLHQGDLVPADGKRAVNDGTGSLSSQQTLTKSLQVGVNVGGVHYDNIIRHESAITFPNGASFFSLESPTTYMPGEFSRHYAFDIDANGLRELPAINSWPDAQGRFETYYSQDKVGPRHRPDPLIFATPDGRHAMAVVPAVPMASGFEDQLIGRLSFPNADPSQATHKWTALMNAANVPAGATLRATTYQVVGDLETVKRTLQAFYANPPA